MKTSELKPKILSILFALYEKDPSPSAYAESSSLLTKIHGASKDEVVNIINHLIHIKFVDSINSNNGILISINDSGITWLDQHNDYIKQKSLKNWLIKPSLVAVVVCIITTPIVIAIQGGILLQAPPSQKFNKDCTRTIKEVKN